MSKSCGRSVGVMEYEIVTTELAINTLPVLSLVAVGLVVRSAVRERGKREKHGVRTDGSMNFFKGPPGQKL